MPSLRIAALTGMTDECVVEQRLSQLVQMEEDRFVVGFHQTIEKQQQKAWHDQHIRVKPFKEGGLVLLYDSKLFKHLGNLKTHWLGPYRIVHITNVGTKKLKKLDGTYVVSMVNDSHLKPYYDMHNIPSKKKRGGQKT